MIRFGILAGVSSDPQVEDKDSIEDQIKTCRRAIAQLGGVEVDCYTMDGYTRTGYDSLADAMHDIPPLKDAIESAEQNAYDVLILDNWDRLGDLGQLVSTRFKKYRKQIYSARQSGRVHDPESYDPYGDESASIDMHVQGILQQYRINKLRRGWSIGMPKRIEKGLTPLRVPFAYRWVNQKEPPAIDPPRAALVQQMKDLLLRGRSLTSIANYADESGIAPPNGGPKWDISTIRYILANPYYAGIVTIHRNKYIYDATRKRKKRPVKQPRAKWTTGKGRHEPLWDEVTHLAIVKELEIRYKTNKHYAVRFAFSGLLTCSECRRKLHRRSHGHGHTRRKVWSCEAGPSHVIITYEEGVDLIIQELVKQLEDEPTPSVRAPKDNDHSQASLDELNRQRKRIQEGLKLGAYKPAEAAEEIGKIERQIERIEQKEEQRAVNVELRAEFMSKFDGNPQGLPEWIKHDDPQAVNRLLAAMCEDIIIHPDRTVEIIWRDPRLEVI